ncbi:MAG: hypothetical protein JJ902_20880 [Roseibium sp.]|nr:hypothetical protein [Roseibium sp.]
MPFTLFKGTFTPQFGRPDGDSMRFVPDNPDPLFHLTRRGAAPKVNGINGSVQLRYEAIDTMESRAKDPFASDATASNLNLAGTNGGAQPARGYIFSNQIGPNGRPIAFVFAGDTAMADGSSHFVKAEDLGDSINVQQLALGHAYPLYYDTLFADLRAFCDQAVNAARSAAKGVWAADVTNTGFGWTDDLKQLPPIFPKLWRRLDSYSRDEIFFEPDAPLSNLKAYIESRRDERVFLRDEQRFAGFDDLVEIDGDQVHLTAEPQNMVVVSQK